MNMLELTLTIVGYGGAFAVGVVGFAALLGKILEMDERDVKRFVRKTKRTIRNIVRR